MIKLFELLIIVDRLCPLKLSASFEMSKNIYLDFVVHLLCFDFPPPLRFFVLS